MAGRLDCELYLALADVHEIWQCEDEWYGDGRRSRRYGLDDEGDESAKADHNLVDLVDESISLQHWIDADGQVARGISAMPVYPEVCFTRPSVEMDPFKSEYEGYMGNYGDTMDRWYHRAAIVIWPRARNFVIRARMSPSWAIGEIDELLKAGAVDEARGRATELLPSWKETAPSETGATFVPRLLAVLAVLADADLAFELLSPLGPHRLGRRHRGVVCGCAAIPAPAIRDDLVGVLVAPETKLPLVTAGALLRKIGDEWTPAEVRALGLQALYGHVVGALVAALAAPERSRDDWTIEAPSRCGCALCQTLASFLRDRDRTRHAWPLAKEKRSHVHGVIDGNRLPVTHTTTRQGSPYTLVLTKQAALFEREAAERSQWKLLLTWLEGQHDVFAAAPAATRMTPSAHRGAGRVASKRRSPPPP